MDQKDTQPVSPKSYGVAVTLSIIFGVLGIHHFYLGNWLHGLLDFSLFVVGIGFIVSEDPTLVPIGTLLIIIDAIHTIWVIPTVIDQNPCAHLRMPRDMIFHGWSMRLFQAWQHSATMSS